MKIACIGWGSLVWEHRDLPIKSDWHCDGPEVPVEFCRQSDNGRITLVIAQGAAAVTTLWCALDAATLDDAVAKLAEREGISAKNTPGRIGRWPAANAQDPALPDGLQKWAQKHEIDGVVWTALGPRFDGRYVTPTSDQIVGYLRSTTGGVRADCERYIRRAPAQIRTAYRIEIERELGWTAAEA
jgi:hypothetical protein